MTPVVAMQVDVVDGNKLSSDTKCTDFKWEVQGHEFHFDMRVLKLGGCDMVLKADWMKEVSFIIFDFNKLIVSFFKEGTNILLQGQSDSATLSMMSDSEVHIFSQE